MSETITILKTLDPRLLATKVWKKVGGKVVVHVITVTLSMSAPI